ncbi:hypothetical protein AB6E39_06865 [Vibrio splendidus]|uniref:hypothetical protein n=1 Tax=Vibrio splendidus TaxID=29497 RepID=UPI001E35B054|nr:hypothetical protein [Vibrio splendidus]MCC4787696.1 hypothetical protein [Vibrio splendidus]
MVITIKFENKTSDEIRKEAARYCIELPLGFDFKQHFSITFCTLTRKIIEVEKRI